MTTFRNILIALLAFVSSACNQISSEHVSTDGIRADVTVIDDGSPTVEVNAQLTLADSLFTYLSLGPSDSLNVSTEGYSRRLHETFLAYSANIPATLGPQDIQVSLNRSGHFSAYNSWVSLPAPFNLFVDTAPGRWGNDEIILEWDMLAQELASIRFDGPCIETYEFSIDPIGDTGITVVGTDELLINYHWSGFECPIDITVTRTRHGQLDRHLEGGAITASQVRSQRIYLYE